MRREELAALCVRVKRARDLVSQVRSYSSLDVRPLYYVWDHALDPPMSIGRESVDVAALARGRTREGLVAVPWRGG